MNKNKFLVAATFVLALLTMLVGSAGAQGQSGTTLSATVDVTPHWTITYGWMIDKAVTPDTLNMFRGDSGTSQYTITVTKDSGTEAAWVDGQVCVTNGGAVDTENLAIAAVLQDGYGPPNDFLTSAAVDVSGYPVIPAGGSHCYAYHVNIPITGGAFPQPHAGGTYKVTADVTITNHSGHLGEPFGPSPSETAVFPPSATLVNDSINVDDTNGSSWAFNASGSVNYTKTFTCDGDAGTHGNTATIFETGQSDGASVTVNCYALEVTKDASTSFDRTYNWTIDKSANQSALTLATGEQFLVNYSVKVDVTGYADSDWAVNGNIHVYNPAPIAATLNSVSDVVTTAIVATVDCGVTFPYSLAAGGTLNCTYGASLPNADSRTNAATATLQNTPSGTTDFSGSAAVDFGTATINHVDECINVTDTYAGSLGTVCIGDAPKTFTYSRYIGAYAVCGDYTVENIASFVTNDTGTTGEDNWTVNVHVPCAGGCTLTQGYWKTHSEFGPAPYDDTWAQLPNGASAPFFLSGKTWYQVFWTPPAGNAYYNLAHQYMAAKLYILNGADPAAAQTALNQATALLNTFTPAQLASMKGSAGNTTRAQFLNLAAILDNYNNGYIGPGHCSE